MSDKLFGLMFYSALLLVPIGWLMNIVKLFGSDGLELAVRVAGIVVAPLGVIMGYF